MNNYLILISILLSFNFQLLSSQDRNTNQEIINFVEQGYYFEAKDLYNSIEADSINPIVKDIYNYYTLKMENKLDSATYYLTTIINNPEFCKSNIILMFCRFLVEDYLNLQNYEQAYLATDKIEDILKENTLELPDDHIEFWSNTVKSMREYIQNIEKYPKTYVSRRNISIDPISMPIDNLKDDMIIFPAIYNGDTLRMYFDTGVTLPFIISEKTLKKNGTDNNIVVNNSSMQSSQAFVDSVKIDNVNMYNVLISTYNIDVSEVTDFDKLNESKKETIKKRFDNFDIIMGLPAMQMMDNIVINFKYETITFPNKIELLSDKEPNLFYRDGFLFTQLKINGLPFTAVIDFGNVNDFIKIHPSFYEKYKLKLPLDTLSVKEPLDIWMLHKAWSDIPYELLLDPLVLFNDKSIKLDEYKIKIYSNPEDPMKELLDGVLGFQFFKALGKRILFDFKNRRLEILEK